MKRFYKVVEARPFAEKFMPEREYPFWTRLEGAVSRVPVLPWCINQWHWLRKKSWIWHRHNVLRRSAESLGHFERKVFSQNGEDGVIEEIFKRVGTTNKTVVEFGVEDGKECNARYLVQQRGWNAILLDGWSEGVRRARELYAQLPVQVVESFITADNIVALFEQQRVPQELDLLVVDIDSNDYWVLEAILKAYRPRVMVVEYNARWTPPTRWIMPYDPTYVWDRSVYCGASLQAFADLGMANQYSLVGCDYQGVNAFFIRNDVVAGKFPDAGKSADYHYQAPLFMKGYGHRIHPPPPKKPVRGLSPAGVSEVVPSA